MLKDDEEAYNQFADAKDDEETKRNLRRVVDHQAGKQKILKEFRGQKKAEPEMKTATTIRRQEIRKRQHLFTRLQRPVPKLSKLWIIYCLLSICLPE